MKHDMNLIRLLLLATEGGEPKPDISAFTEEQQLYHSALVVEWFHARFDFEDGITHRR